MLTRLWTARLGHATCANAYAAESPERTRIKRLLSNKLRLPKGLRQRGSSLATPFVKEHEHVW